MRRLLNWFLQGLLYLVPIWLTIVIFASTFRGIDGMLRRLFGLEVPGAGVLVMVLLTTIFGFFLSRYLSNRVLRKAESLVDRLPLIKLLHTSVKDLMGAFVGENRRFDTAVAVEIVPDSGTFAFGFVTRQAVPEFGLAEDQVAVYFPQSYNFAGLVLTVPRSRVRPLTLDPAEVMAFIVSGGVAGAHARPVAGAQARPIVAKH